MRLAAFDICIDSDNFFKHIYSRSVKCGQGCSMLRCEKQVKPEAPILAVTLPNQVTAGARSLSCVTHFHLPTTLNLPL